MKWIVLAFWVLISSGYLYFVNLAVPDELSFKSFFLFTVMLTGGGLSYDIASKIFSIPSCRGYWTQLLKQMGLVFLGFILVVAGIFMAGYLSNLVNFTMSSSIGFLVSLLGILLACYQSYKAENTFRELHAS